MNEKFLQHWPLLPVWLFKKGRAERWGFLRKQQLKSVAFSFLSCDFPKQVISLGISWMRMASQLQACPKIFGWAGLCGTGRELPGAASAAGFLQKSRTVVMMPEIRHGDLGMPALISWTQPATPGMSLLEEK